MQAAATITTNQREQSEQARVRALVRFNGLTFHSIAMASFLETAVPLQVNRLAQVFGAHSDTGSWLEQVWWPQRAELGRQLREYIEATWPEFEWNAAYQEFCESYRPRSGLAKRDSGLALEALGLCVTAAQAALFYRALASSADEPALRSCRPFRLFPRPVRALQAKRTHRICRHVAHGDRGQPLRARS